MPQSGSVLPLSHEIAAPRQAPADFRANEPSRAVARVLLLNATMKDIVVILHREAVPAAAQVCATLADYEVFLFDAPIGDPVTAAGLRNVRLFTQISAPSYHTMDRDAHTAAFDIEAQLDAAQGAMTDLSIIGWQHLNLYYLFLALRWYDELWGSIGHHLQGNRIHLLVNDNPAEFYFNSFIAGASLIRYLQKHRTPVLAYDYGANGNAVYKVPNFFVDTPADIDSFVLTHIPTCLYDGGHFFDELRAAGRRTINLESKYWHTPHEAEVQIGLIDMQGALAKRPSSTREEVDTFTRALRDVLYRCLTPYFGLANYCARQVEHLARLYASQFVTYLELQRYFHQSAPEKFVLCEHDTGFLGPLITFAERRSRPIILLPHSKVSGDIAFAYDNILILTHPAQGLPIHDARRVPVPSLPIIYPEHPIGNDAPSQGLHTISLLLNGLSLNGVPYAPTDVHLNGIQRIVGWCKQHEIRLKIRCRPGYSIVNLLSASVGIASDVLWQGLNQTMEEHARGCDLCLMYDMPTTAAMIFLRNSIPILNPVVTLPTKPFLAINHPDVVVTESLDGTLHRLDEFLADPLKLCAFRSAQFRAYSSLFEAARPLRSFFELPDSLVSAAAAAPRQRCDDRLAPAHQVL